MDTNILLETGTNELEVLEFVVAGHSFGINVAKVRELIQFQPVQAMPRSQPFVEGIFKPRDEVFTVIDLALYLGLPSSDDTERDIFIVAGFNKMNIAFHVHSVESIQRISWQDIEKPDTTIFGGGEGTITGIAKYSDKMVSIIDFEKVVFDISPDKSIQLSEIDELGARSQSEKTILIAEDSMLLRKMLLEALHKAGYSNVISASNGKEAWDILMEIREEMLADNSPIEKHCCCLITDIEMPQMDGHHLTKNVKSDPFLKKLPVIIFSSLIDEAMRLKGEEVGASGQLSKPEIANLVTVIDQFIL